MAKELTAENLLGGGLAAMLRRQVKRYPNLIEDLAKLPSIMDGLIEAGHLMPTFEPTEYGEAYPDMRYRWRILDL